MKNTARWLLLFFISQMALTAQNITSPKEFLGYELGDSFTNHHRILDYFHLLATNSELARWQRYGTTYQGRELGVMTVSAQRNMSRIEEIKAAHAQLRNAQKASPDVPAVVWLSFGVHGNESSSSEVAMQVAYELVSDSAHTKLLDSLVVIIDPCLNPDGRERYVNWYKNKKGRLPNPDKYSIEHDEPWPGGRTNHYLFDLNRDWAWATQGETKARLKRYQQWYPQVHVDYHEMWANSSYFFFPPQDPIIKEIPKPTIEWMHKIGRGNAKAFDEKGWLYYTEQDFDLFYPGYGDSWPSLNGAIGMTYEQAGHSIGGLVFKSKDGQMLTLKDRIAHHKLTAITTLQTVANEKSACLQQYRNYWKWERKDNEYSGFLIRPKRSQNRFRAFVSNLIEQNIDVFQIKKPSSGFDGFDPYLKKKVEIKRSGNAVFVPFDQQQARLVNALLEPHHAISDTFLYDLTAWSTAAAFGVDLNKAKLKSDDLGASLSIDSFKKTIQIELAKYAYVLHWDDIPSAAALTFLLRKKVRCYAAKKPFQINKEKYGRGAIIIPLSANQHIENVEKIIQQTADKWNQEIVAVSTGMSEDGIDLGSDDVAWLEPVKIAVLTEEPFSAYSYGTIWYLFDQWTETPFSAIRPERISRNVLSEYNVLIFPDSRGALSSEIDSAQVAEIKSWVRAGGTLIAMGNSTDFITSKKNQLSAVKVQKKVEQDSSKSKADDKMKLARRTLEQKQHDRWDDSISGAILKMGIDTTHPLGFGIEEEIYFLKRGKRIFKLAESSHNVGIFPENSYVAGFMNQKNKKHFDDKVGITVESKGRGHIILFSDDPNFRLMWRSTTALFLNAVFFGSIM